MRSMRAVGCSPIMNQRVSWLRGVYYLFLFLVLSRLFYWQILQGDRLQAAARNQYESVFTLNSSRGKIFSSDGFPLASNRNVYTLFVEPQKFSADPASVSAMLAPLFLDADDDPSLASESARLVALEQWQNTLTSRLKNSELRWVLLKRRLPTEYRKKIEAYGIAGLGFERDEQRFYPEASTAAQLLGFVGSDERGEEQGYFGVEGLFDRELRGKRGEVRLERDAVGAPIAIGEYDEISARNGRDLVLTIRRDLQFMLESQLQKGMEKYGSKTAEGIIVDPKTGVILAMASLPAYDPAKYYRFPPEQYKNLLASDVYEPGSTLKILTMAAGVDAGAITPESQCDKCSGPREISGFSIKTWNNEYTPNTTMTQALVHSDNTAMIFAMEKMGKETFIEYLKKFGLDRKTNSDIQEEAGPQFRKDWKDIDAATASFGQGLAVTGLQMIRVAQTIANGGEMMRPMLVGSVRENGEEIPIQPRPEGRVISEKTAQTVTAMMEESAKYGDAKWALPKGYRIAGKTGTAQIAVKGHYDEEKTVTSFIGFAPAQDPKFVMLIKLREPQSSQWGSETAAPLWFSIAKELFLRMNIPPEGV